MELDPELLAKLVCPKCHGALQATTDGTGLDCNSCRLRYAVEKYGEDVWVPDMIIEHATDLRSKNGG
ncbi:MAG TPA: Trm112 family protein [bacterium]|nr:Trm112 family protein [bacterium]